MALAVALALVSARRPATAPGAPAAPASAALHAARAPTRPARRRHRLGGAQASPLAAACASAAPFPISPAPSWRPAAVTPRCPGEGAAMFASQRPQRLAGWQSATMPAGRGRHRCSCRCCRLRCRCHRRVGSMTAPPPRRHQRHAAVAPAAESVSLAGGGRPGRGLSLSLRPPARACDCQGGWVRRRAPCRAGKQEWAPCPFSCGDAGRPAAGSGPAAAPPRICARWLRCLATRTARSAAPCLAAACAAGVMAGTSWISCLARSPTLTIPPSRSPSPVSHGSLLPSLLPSLTPEAVLASSPSRRFRARNLQTRRSPRAHPSSAPTEQRVPRGAA